MAKTVKETLEELDAEGVPLLVTHGISAAIFDAAVSVAPNSALYVDSQGRAFNIHFEGQLPAEVEEEEIPRNAVFDAEGRKLS